MLINRYPLLHCEHTGSAVRQLLGVQKEVTGLLSMNLFMQEQLESLIRFELFGQV